MSEPEPIPLWRPHERTAQWFLLGAALLVLLATAEGIHALRLRHAWWTAPPSTSDSA